ncbi:MAG: hypothetical protein JWQ71_1094 [Pedosphaera sp.]|nr:hypothetical protein [Pedosphaera sp.]
MNNLFSKSLFISVCVISLCGCITHNETVYRNPERMKVEFENETAARIFYETLSKTTVPSARRESNTSIEIPVVFEHHSHVIDGENVAFNSAVKQCDTNQDGKITQLEARIFSELRQKRAH